MMATAPIVFWGAFEWALATALYQISRLASPQRLDANSQGVIIRLLPKMCIQNGENHLVWALQLKSLAVGFKLVRCYSLKSF